MVLSGDVAALASCGHEEVPVPETPVFRDIVPEQTELTVARGDHLRAMTRKEFNALLREVFADALEHSVSVVAHGSAANEKQG